MSNCAAALEFSMLSTNCVSIIPAVPTNISDTVPLPDTTLGESGIVTTAFSAIAPPVNDPTCVAVAGLLFQVTELSLQSLVAVV